NLAFAEAHTSSIASYDYRQKLAELLRRQKWSALAQIDKQTRSSCYKLMDRIEEIAVWYAQLPGNDKMRWQHPDTIVKHAPRHLAQAAMRNVPRKKGPKKRARDGGGVSATEAPDRDHRRVRHAVESAAGGRAVQADLSGRRAERRPRRPRRSQRVRCQAM